MRDYCPWLSWSLGARSGRARQADELDGEVVVRPQRGPAGQRIPQLDGSNALTCENGGGRDRV
jgi:hypothetical protein